MPANRLAEPPVAAIRAVTLPRNDLICARKVALKRPLAHRLLATPCHPSIQKSVPQLRLRGYQPHHTRPGALLIPLALILGPAELLATDPTDPVVRRRVQVHFAPVYPATVPVPLASLAPAQAAAHAAAAGQLSIDQYFLRRVSESMFRHLADEDFGVDEQGADIGMSHIQIHRKLKALTGQ